MSVSNKDLSGTNKNVSSRLHERLKRMLLKFDWMIDFVFKKAELGVLKLNL